MPVVDKYQPVDATPSSLSPPGAVLAGCIVLATMLALFSGETMARRVIYDTELWNPTSATLQAIADVAEATGITSVRTTLDGLTDPLDDGPRILKAPLPMPLPPEQPVEPPPVEPDVPPGERWAATGTPGAKRRVLVVGASSIQYAVGTELERLLAEGYQLDVRRKGKVSTGLTRDDVFDWPAEIADLMAEFQPDLVVGQFGGNDGQPIVSPTEGPQQIYTEGWETEYARRITALTEQVRNDGADLVLVGMPLMRSGRFSKKIRWLNGITEGAVQGAGGRYVDIYDLAGDDDGDYRADVRFGGRAGRMRMDDGIHFTRLGGQYVAFHLAHRLEREVLLLPKADDPVETDAVVPTPPAAAHRLTIPSLQRGPTPALAFVPQDVPTEGLPVWFLLHGAWDDWTAWSERAHDTLAELAAEHRMIIVLPDGEPFGYWMDATKEPDHRLATWFANALVPHVDDVLPSNRTRAISGVSMGGHGALTLAMASPGRYAAATSMSGAVDLTQTRVDRVTELLGPLDENETAWKARSTLHLVADRPARVDGLALLLSCAKDDPWWYASNVQLHDLLAVHGIEHTWDPQEGGGHTWPVWLEALPRHAAFVAGVVQPVPEPVAPMTDPEAPADE